MKTITVLIKREWWEWRKTIYWTVGVFTFLLLLSLVPVLRFSHTIETSINNPNGHVDMSHFQFRGDNSLPDIIDKYGVQGLENELSENPQILLKPYGEGLIIGFHLLQALIFFVALFYFSDSLFKERFDSSTLYFRSQPVGDHQIILSKIAAGFLGIILTSLAMSFILLIHSKILIWSFSEEISDLVLPILSRLQMIDLFTDMILFQFVALLWISPFILFLMLVSSYVKGRPLIVGIGLPILFSIVLQIIFGHHELITYIGDIAGNIKDMHTEQMLLKWGHSINSETVEVFGSFWKYLFSIRTFVTLLITSGLYFLTWKVYRKNIVTS